MRGVLAAGLAVGLAVAVVGTAILASAASLLGVGSGAPAASSAAAAKIPPAMLALYEQAAVDDRGRHRHGGVGQRAVDAARGAQRSQLRGRGGADAVRADDFSCSRTSNSSLTCRFRSSGSGSGPRHRAAPSGEGGALPARVERGLPGRRLGPLHGIPWRRHHLGAGGGVEGMMTGRQGRRALVERRRVESMPGILLGGLRWRSGNVIPAESAESADL
jgi:hypothetical protein